MTLTESEIELAGATGVDALVLHHPVAEAASSGGVPLRGYVNLYNLAIFEAHEAFHGRHPGIGVIHGHVPFQDLHRVWRGAGECGLHWKAPSGNQEGTRHRRPCEGHLPTCPARRRFWRASDSRGSLLTFRRPT